MDVLERHSRQVIEQCRDHGLTLATAESCTGGLIAASLTDVPGASQVFDRGFVTYSNEAKTELLGVASDLIADHGAVSEQVAREMAQGALQRAKTSIAVAVTGVAGPDGGTKEKPVGLVHIACARKEHPTLHQKCLFGPLTRKEIRLKTVESALSLIAQQIPAADLA